MNTFINRNIAINNIDNNETHTLISGIVQTKNEMKTF